MLNNLPSAGMETSNHGHQLFLIVSSLSLQVRVHHQGISCCIKLEHKNLHYAYRFHRLCDYRMHCYLGSTGWYLDRFEVYKKERRACTYGRLYVITQSIYFTIFNNNIYHNNKIIKNNYRIIFENYLFILLFLDHRVYLSKEYSIFYATHSQH